MPTATCTTESVTDHPEDDAHHRTLARVAADRASSLRHQAADITTDTLEPLRVALRIRAAELELAAAALGDEQSSLLRRPG